MKTSSYTNYYLTPITIQDLIQPIFKSGNKNDPNNYRGICLSSSILKLITSLIYQRLVVKVDELKLISKNQIGFRSKSRTSDHLLTIKNIAKKFVTIGKKKTVPMLYRF